MHVPYQREILLFIGNAFFDKYLVQHLANAGYQLHLVGKYHHLHALSLLGYIDQLHLIPSSSLCIKEIKSLIKNKYIVINCIENLRLDSHHIKDLSWPIILAKYCEDSQANLLHIANIHHTDVTNHSITDNCTRAVTLQTHMIFGQQDRFCSTLSFMAHFYRRILLPKYNNSPMLFPIYAADVATVMGHIISDPGCHYGKNYRLKGMQSFSLMSIGQLITRNYNLPNKAIIQIPRFIIRCLKILPKWTTHLNNNTKDSTNAINFDIPIAMRSLTDYVAHDLSQYLTRISDKSRFTNNSHYSHKKI